MPTLRPGTIKPFCSVYDFATDGGSIGTFNLGIVSHNSTIISYHVQILTTLAGNVASVVSFGFTNSSIALFTYVIGNYGTTGNITTGSPGIRIPDAENITMSISAFPLTAGKLKFIALIFTTDV